MNAITRKWLLILLIGLLPILFVTAQEQDAPAEGVPTGVSFSYVESTPREGGLGLDVYFTIVDGQDRVITQTQVEEAQIIFDNNSPETQLDQADADYYIALVLDVSGSMVNALDTMREAAINAIDNAPSGAHFSVIRFDDQVAILTGNFTDVANEAVNAIRIGIISRGGGTCLYDAAYVAVEQLNAVTTDRKAVILFTDGRDERIAGGSLNDTCSIHTLDEVIALASEGRITIHTIGLTGSQVQINENELAQISGSTGGFSVIGNQTQLPALFEQIMGGLRSQWLASAVVYPPSGQQEATLRVTLEDGTVLRTFFDFTANASFVQTPTPVPTAFVPSPTPLPVRLEISGVRLEDNQNRGSFELLVQNGEPVEGYLFSITNQDTGLQESEFNQSAPIDGRVPFETLNLGTGDYIISARALAEDSSSLARAEAQFAIRRPMPTPTASFTPTKTSTPTATPTATETPTPTYTPVPIGCTLEGIQYNETAEQFRLRLSCRSRSEIDSLRIQFIDASTNIEVGPPFNIPLPVEDIVPINASGFAPGRYRVRVSSLNRAGDTLLNPADGDPIVSTLDFTYQPSTPTPTVTPTETNTATATPTATTTPTPVIVNVTIGQIQSDGEFLVISVQALNAQLIRRYQVEFINSGSGFVDYNETYAATEEGFRVALSELHLGENYTIIVRPLGEDGRPVGDEDSRGISLDAPPPQPTATPTPPTDAPPRSPLLGLPLWLIILVMVVIIIGLLLLLYILARPPGRPPQSGHGNRGEYTKPYSGGLPPVAPNGDKNAPDPNKTNFPDSNRTNPAARVLLPAATLTITAAPEVELIGKNATILTVPFRIGRKDPYIPTPNFDLDPNKDVSREHAVITYGEGVFYIEDLESSQGTSVNDIRLMPNQRQPLNGGDHILLAGNILMMFEMPIKSDAEKTRAEG